jgi:hypothetical protein
VRLEEINLMAWTELLEVQVGIEEIDLMAQTELLQVQMGMGEMYLMARCRSLRVMVTLFLKFQIFFQRSYVFYDLHFHYFYLNLKNNCFFLVLYTHKNSG